MVRDRCIEGADDLIGGVAITILAAGEKFIEVLVDVVGSFVPQQLCDLVDVLEEVWSDKTIEKLKVELIEGLHRKGDGLGCRHLNSIITFLSPFRAYPTF